VRVLSRASRGTHRAQTISNSVLFREKTCYTIFLGRPSRKLPARLASEQRSHREVATVSVACERSFTTDIVEREQALEEFRQILADVLDWSTAQYNNGEVLMHT
jgi:hypothetical protein